MGLIYSQFYTQLNKYIKINIKEIIHIDDEELLRRAWKKYFNERGIAVHSFSSPTEFLALDQSLATSSPVFIDSYMGAEERGEDFAKKMFDNDFQYIYLASNDASHIEISNYPWIKKTMGKSAKNALGNLLSDLG